MDELLSRVLDVHGSSVNVVALRQCGCGRLFPQPLKGDFRSQRCVNCASALFRHSSLHLARQSGSFSNSAIGSKIGVHFYPRPPSTQPR